MANFFFQFEKLFIADGPFVPNDTREVKNIIKTG